MIVKEPENICTLCGAVIPESKQICPMCGTKDEAESFARLIRRKIPKEEHPLATAARETALKIRDDIEQAFRQGFTEGMKAACELKQDNEQLKRENAFLKGQIEARMRLDDVDAEFE